ncbi:MAG: hypothetical protein E6053_09305 [Finegoldia magna]|uniref:Uncharacterized protein n=1 Tax=Finegoldia magna (strain ATCC 29328 / DSM 20472 / WAL 2508) TaxID=334413 RepID=B0S474_FINM2|nr:hypothetical protein [Finegoldia magna]MDU5527648.1 hypothetical protein [Finegoldia magna]UEA71257.1 hypothetical protein LK415_09080 [Finegoldia magna]BAG09065.1 hypothetical protein FMG_P0016 [Finegoldia magna ATCC 29328]
MEKYIKKKGILVGTFTEEQLKKKIDKLEVDKAMEKYGLKYTNTELVRKGGKIVGLKVYVCNWEDVDLNW